MKDLDQLESGSINLDQFIANLDLRKDEEILSQIERLSRSLLKKIKTLTTLETESFFSSFPRRCRLIELLGRSASENSRFLLALILGYSEHLVENADFEPELAIRGLSIVDPSFTWIAQASKKSSNELYDLLIQIDPELIAQKPDVIRGIVSELHSTIDQQQRDFLFKLLTKCFIRRMELTGLVSKRLDDLCSRLPINADLELSVSFLTSIQRSVNSAEIAKDLAKKLEQVYLRDKEREPDNLLERGLKLFFNKTLPSVVELIPLLALWEESLLITLSSMTDESLLRGIFKNAHLCLHDHAGLDELFRARSSLIDSISPTEFDEKELLDGSGALRRVSNSWLIMIPPISKDYRQKRKPPIPSPAVEGKPFTMATNDVAHHVSKSLFQVNLQVPINLFRREYLGRESDSFWLVTAVQASQVFSVGSDKMQCRQQTEQKSRLSTSKTGNLSIITIFRHSTILPQMFNTTTQLFRIR